MGPWRRRLLRVLDALVERLWRGDHLPTIPRTLQIDTPTRKLTALCQRLGAFHSVARVGSGMWRVRVHKRNGDVLACTGHEIDEAIDALVTRCDEGS